MYNKCILIKCCAGGKGWDMQLTRHTDLALRVLMVLGAGPQERRWRIEELAGALVVSEHHLRKVVNKLGQHGWLTPMRGRNGGVRAAPGANAVRVGDVARAFEPTLEMIDCDHPACSLRADCRLKQLLREAESAFIRVLDGCRLGDLATGRGLALLLDKKD